MKELDKTYVKNLASTYIIKNDNKVESLKKLDQKVKLFPNVLAYTLGIILTLTFGFSMCLCLDVILIDYKYSLVIGIVLGIISIILMIFNFTLYKKILNYRKRKYASDIITLANKILEE